MKEILKLGFIGLGCRGMGMLKCVYSMFFDKDIQVLAVCDLYEDRAEDARDFIIEKTGITPLCTTDYHEVLAVADIDAVVVSTSWEAHIEVAIAAMKAGKYVGMEVGGAYTVDECWELVRTSEETGMHCMMMENCCYGQREMMVLNMERKGFLGEIVHCGGGYCHDLRSEIANGEFNRHYRLRNYLSRNCDNYPTHALGPIAKTIGINRGNQFVSVSSFSSVAKGLHQYFADDPEKYEKYLDAEVKQGDVITTIITCAGGQTIVLTLDTTTPRGYSRSYLVKGTKGMYMEDNDSLCVDGVNSDIHIYDWKPMWNNAKDYEEQFDHPIWREINGDDFKELHGGMDVLVIRAFIECAKRNIQPPIDVYDAAAWASISALSAESIRQGSVPVAAPDFTCGKWKNREEEPMHKYTLGTVVEDHEMSIL